MADLPTINVLPLEKARELLLQCCHSTKWANTIVRLRPFQSDQSLFDAAESAFNAFHSNDWLEAFEGHPRIGASVSRGSTGKWESQEQSGVKESTPDLLDELKLFNEKYEKKFGHVFLVCATGKSATEMLDLLKIRLKHTSEEELKFASREQRKITRIRLEKLLRDK